MKTLHIIPNAHLDPVWLWDWREGLNEGIATCRTMVQLMREFPDLTFIRGESSIYEHIEKYAPETFAAIRDLVQSGRWEIVGGNYVQPDTNLPSEETFLKQYEIGKKYFREKFGVEVNCAWAPDSFGHSGGLPDIYERSGFRYFAFTRPVDPLMPDFASPVFRWRGVGGGSVLTLFDTVAKCYCMGTRSGTSKRLDLALEKSAVIPLNHIAVFMGLGNHGGGTCREELEEIAAWKELHKNDIEVRFSTLGNYFAAVENENTDFPEYQGEINFCLRGCFTSAAGVKADFRRAENSLIRAERSARWVQKQSGTEPPDFTDEWKDLLFNTFHDILPGTSVDHAMREQQDWMRGIIHAARKKEFESLNGFLANSTVKVPPTGKYEPLAVPHFLLNPTNHSGTQLVELESCLDYRPLQAYLGQGNNTPCELLDEAGNPVPFQRLDVEHDMWPDDPWRARVLAKLDFKAMSSRLVTLGFKEKPVLAPVTSRFSATENSITNGEITISAAAGEESLHITRNGKELFADNGIRVTIFEDNYGSWGAGSRNADPAGIYLKELENWKIETVKVVEKGPLRAMLFVVFSGGRSQLRLKITIEDGTQKISLSGQLIWQERMRRLRLLLNPVKHAVYQVPCGEIKREVRGDVPGGRYQILDNNWGIATDVVTSFAHLEDFFAINLIRGCRSASYQATPDEELLFRPITDYGEHRFQLLFAPASEIREAAETLNFPPVQIMAWANQ